MLNEGLSSTTKLAKVRSRELGTQGIIISQDSSGNVWGEIVAIVRRM